MSLSQNNTERFIDITSYNFLVHHSVTMETAWSPRLVTDKICRMMEKGKSQKNHREINPLASVVFPSLS